MLLNRLIRCFSALTLSTVALHGALAIDYRAVQNGAWHNSTTWQPEGVPGAGDRVLGLANFAISIAEDAQIGSGGTTTALTVDGGGRLHVEDGATLMLHGHLAQTGYRSQVSIGAGAAIRFNPATGDILEWRQGSSEQRIVLAGESGNRARIGLAAGAPGHYAFTNPGFRDSLLSGRYGVVEDAFDPRTEKGWEQYLNNSPGQSRLVLDHIEFLRCGQISVLGLGAGEHTEVDLNAITFRDQAKAGDDYRVPAFAFDGFGDINYVSPPSLATKRLSNIVSDTRINLRFLQGYTLENLVLDAPGSGNARVGNNGGNAVVQRNTFQASARSGSATNLIADLTENFYFYTESDNPHGMATPELRGDATLRNYWFEVGEAPATDRGDAVLTNGPQNWVTRYQGEVPVVLVEHSGIVAPTLEGSGFPTLMTFNNSAGIRVRLEHNVAPVSPDFPAVALDENGLTPTGTGLSFRNNIVYEPAKLGSGQGIGSARPGFDVVEPNAFVMVDFNLYSSLQSSGPGGALGVHNAVLEPGTDGNSLLGDPEFADATRDLAAWDSVLGGPGTARHAIEELKKRNDDSGYNPAYNVADLLAYVATGFATTNSLAVGDDDRPIGPDLYRSVALPPNLSTLAILVGNANSPIASDQLIINQLREIGYTVLLYDDDSPRAALDEQHNAILISSSTLSSKLGRRFQNAPQPILVWEVAQLPALGMTGGRIGIDFGTAPLARNVELPEGSPLADSNHPPGLIQVNNRPSPFVFGKPGVEAEILADIPGQSDKAAIFAYAPNTTLANGRNAPGKRVGWFEQANTASNRTPAGQDLFRKVIALLLGDESTTPEPPPEPLPELPTVALRPVEIAATEGEEIMFQAVVTGTPTPSLQWLRNNVIVPGETTTQLSLIASPMTAGTYQLRAANSVGTTVSDPATLTVSSQGDTPRIAFIVGDPMFTRPGDRDMRQLLEAFGFRVTVVDDNSDLAQTTAAAEILVISSTAVPRLVGNQFSDDARAILTWNAELFDDLWLTGGQRGADFGVTSQGRTAVTLLNNENQLAEGLEPGRLPVTTRFHRQSWGKPTAAALVIARVTSNPEQITLFRYSAGATLANGEPSPGRRIGWFGTDRTAKDLTAQARSLLGGALAWLAE